MKLEQISAEHETAFLSMIADYQKNDAENFAKLFKGKWDSAGFKKFVKDCEKQRMDWRPGAKGVSLTRYVLVDEKGICGNGLMRFPLDEKTEVEGGNLSFDVPPSRRGEGFGAFVLNRMLFEAVRAGMARVLVTCFSDDQAAIHSIEKNRGELENTVTSLSDPKRKVNRYWIRFR